MTVRPLEAPSAAAWLESLPARGAVVLYKHSPVCHVSARVVHDVTRFASLHPAVPVYQLDVLAQRELSQDLAGALGVEHRSPQLVWLTDRRVAWSVAYYEIRLNRLEREAARLGFGPGPAPEDPPSAG